VCPVELDAVESRLLRSDCRFDKVVNDLFYRIFSQLGWHILVVELVTDRRRSDRWQAADPRTGLPAGVRNLKDNRRLELMNRVSDFPVRWNNTVAINHQHPVQWAFPVRLDTCVSGNYRPCPSFGQTDVEILELFSRATEFVGHAFVGG